MKIAGKLIILVLAFLALIAGAYAAENGPLHEAVIHCDKAKIEALIAKGADVNARGRDGWRPLHIAASQCELGIVELLVGKGAAIDVKDNDFGWTPLHRAAQYHSSKKDVIVFFLAKGADINSKGRYSSTPLHEAARTENKDIVELLLNNGADINKYANVWVHPIRYRHRSFVDPCCFGGQGQRRNNQPAGKSPAAAGKEPARIIGAACSAA